MNNDAYTVLIVDDDPDVLFATTRIVTTQGYQVLNAASGAECRSMVEQHHPDLILLDVMLPDTDGAQLCNEIKSDPSYKNIFIVLISGMKTASDDQAFGLDSGADGYISRPISNKELTARVNAMIRIIRAERERNRLVIELQKALETVKKLGGLLPICSYCKQIRDDSGYWRQVEEYIEKHSEAEFSHSICPKCAREHFPDIDLYDD